MRSITVAKNAGFCFGVTRATRAVEAEIAKHIKGQRIYTLGKLIHNDTYNKRLSDAGVGVIEADEIRALANTATSESPVKVFVRAHGITAEVEAILFECAAKNEHFSFEDCTCSFVKKIHKITEENSDGENLLLVLGSASHPEVVGFCSRFSGKKHIFQASSEFESVVEQNKDDFDCAKCIILVAQTTQNLGEWEKNKKTFEKGMYKPDNF